MQITYTSHTNFFSLTISQTKAFFLFMCLVPADFFFTNKSHHMHITCTSQTKAFFLFMCLVPADFFFANRSHHIHTTYTPHTHIFLVPANFFLLTDHITCTSHAHHMHITYTCTSSRAALLREKHNEANQQGKTPISGMNFGFVMFIEVTWVMPLVHEKFDFLMNHFLHQACLGRRPKRFSMSR